MSAANYKRGFQRIYAVVCVVWIAAILWNSLNDGYLIPPAVGSRWFYGAVMVGLMVVTPILGYFVLFVLIPWIGRGFRPNIEKSK